MSVKQVLQKTPLVKNLYFYLKKKRQERRYLEQPEEMNKLRYKNIIGKEPDLENPSDFNEKLMWLMLRTYYNNDLITQCVDKYRMREYIKKCGCEELLVPLIGCWDDVNKIEWDKLPNQFAIKCNHGCGYNIICTDKKNFDVKAAKKKLSAWMKDKYTKHSGEVNYKYVKPLILCEKYISDGKNSLPIDYKVHCCNGEPVVTLLCTERSTGIKLCFVDEDYNIVPYATGAHAGNSIPEKPENFDKMLMYAKKLSADFPFVRVDFYNVSGKLYLGELTFSPYGCTIDYITREGLDELGDRLDISKEIKEWNLRKKGAGK